MCLRPTREWPWAIVFAHTVRVYVAHGSSVEEGVNSSVFPEVVHVPATAGRSIGRGELTVGGAESVTPSALVPLVIDPGGICRTRVGLGGFGGGAGTPEDPGSRLEMWP
jgi:hypothetical protein